MAENLSPNGISLTSNSGEPIVLEGLNLSKSYDEGGGRTLEVLKNINISIRAGDKVAIVGASGSGKSTLLHLLGGLDKPTHGEVFINSHNVDRLSEAELCRLRNRNLGFIYQFHHLLPEFTAQENVAMPALSQGRRPSQALNKARILLE